MLVNVGARFIYWRVWGLISKLKARLGAENDLFFQTALSLFVRVIAALAGFFVSLLIGRYLGADDAGYYFLAFSIVMFLSAISRMGLDNTVVRFVGASAPQGEWGIVRSIIKKALLVSLVVSVILAFFVYLFSDFLAISVFGKEELGGVLKSISPGIVGLSLFTLIAMGLQGIRRVIASVVTVNITVNLVLAIFIVLFGISVAEETALAFSVASGITLVLGGALFLNNLSRSDGRVAWRELFQSCLPLWIVVIMHQTVQWSGQFISGIWVESEQVAQLAVAQRTAMLVTFILMAVNLVVAPRFADMYRQGKVKELEVLALTSVKLMVIFALPIVLLMLIFPTFIMGIFGEGFQEGSHLLQILAIGQFLNVVTGSVGYLLTMSGHEKDLRNATLISGPLALVLGFSLAPVFGATGAAIATAVAVATQNLVAVWWVKKRLGFNTLAVWKA